MMNPIVVLGGTGFVGNALVTRLAQDGHRLRVLTRNAARAKSLAVLPNVEIVTANVHDSVVLSRQFAGAEVVINLVGILNESGRSGAGFMRAHAELARKVVDAAAARNVARLLHMSSLGADAQQGPSFYLRSKGVAEQHLRSAPESLAWTAFRPSVIFGPGDSFVLRFASLLALTQGWIPLARPKTRFAPVYVGDVVEAFARCLPGGSHADVSRRQTFELCGPDVLTLTDIVRYAGEVSGTPAHIIPLPDAIARLQGFVMDFVPGKPFSSDNYRSLLQDSVCREPGCARLGITPASMRAIVPGYLGRGRRGENLNRFRSVAGR